MGRPRSSLESTFIRAATYYLLLCIHKAFFVYLHLLSRPILASSLTIFFLQGSASHAEGRAGLNLSSFSPLNAEHIKSWLLRLLLSLFMRRLPTRRSEEPAVDERQPSRLIPAPHCTMIPLSTRSCLKSNKLRPVLNGQFCHAISKNIGLNVFRSKQPREILVFLTLKL